MADAIKTWLRWAAGLLLAVAALWFGLSQRKHQRKADALTEKAQQLEAGKVQHVAEAKAAREEAAAEAAKAEAALLNGRARIKRLEARSGEDVAARVRALNHRLRNG